MKQQSFFESKQPVYCDRWFQLFNDADPRLVKKFLEFKSKNQPLYDLFQKFAFEAKDRGRKRFSIWMIANRIRWYTQVETTGREFKVSNDYLALFARHMIYDHPEFEGFFKLKAMKHRRTKARD